MPRGRVLTRFTHADDDGEKETRVLEEYIKSKDDGGGGGRTRRGRLREGAKVEARYRGRSKFYPGRIARDRGDGTFDIDYDDGEKETRVLEEYIKGMDSDDEDDRRGGGKLREGDKVEARYRGREKYYPGKISRDRGDGTFDIAYDDGERETRVEERLVRKSYDAMLEAGLDGQTYPFSLYFDRYKFEGAVAVMMVTVAAETTAARVRLTRTLKSSAPKPQPPPAAGPAAAAAVVPTTTARNGSSRSQTSTRVRSGRTSRRASVRGSGRSALRCASTRRSGSAGERALSKSL